MNSDQVILQILDLARWAPSGDNAQPWRFQVLDGLNFVIHGTDTRDHCIYDLDGRPTQLALGALIETAAIAASRHGLHLDARLRPITDPTRPTFDIRLLPKADLKTDMLWRVIAERSVNRGRLGRAPLTGEHWQALRAAVGADHELVAFEGAQRLAWASLLWANGGLRLRLPEAFDTHRGVIDWDKRYSRIGIPDQALGVDAVTLGVMRRAMSSWERVEFMNRWLAGTQMPRLLMDFLPALFCGAHIAVLAKHPPSTVEDYVAGGRAVQRFWLTAATLGLQHQPAATPLVFSRYLREGTRFTANGEEIHVASRLANRLNELLADKADRALWLGRIGRGQAATSRSVRRILSEMLVGPSDP